MKSSFKLNINNKIITFSSVFGIILVSLIIFIVYPLYSDIKKLNIELYDQRVQLATFQKQRLNLDETRKEYNDIKADIDNITSVLVKRDNLLEFIDSLDIIALETNTIQKINLNNLDEAVKSENLQINVSLTGTWDNLNKYLYTIENLDYYMLMDNTSMTLNDDGNVNMDFNLVIYLE